MGEGREGVFVCRRALAGTKKSYCAGSGIARGIVARSSA